MVNSTTIFKPPSRVRVKVRVEVQDRPRRVLSSLTLVMVTSSPTTVPPQASATASL